MVSKEFPAFKASYEAEMNQEVISALSLPQGVYPDRILLRTSYPPIFIVYSIQQALLFAMIIFPMRDLLHDPLQGVRRDLGPCRFKRLTETCEGKVTRLCHGLFHDTPALLYGLKLGMIWRWTQHGHMAICRQRVGAQHMVEFA